MQNFKQYLQESSLINKKIPPFLIERGTLYKVIDVMDVEVGRNKHNFIIHDNDTVEIHSVNVNTNKIKLYWQEADDNLLRMTDLDFFFECCAYIAHPSKISNLLVLLKTPLLKVTTEVSGDYKRAIEIVNHYLANNKDDILGCQDELLENGLKEYAKL